MNFKDILILFIIYSTVGFFVEVIYTFIRDREFVNRGFLIGPYCPIYGVSVSLITFSLQKYLNDKIILYVMCILLCSFSEYFTSYIMEKIFNARWWDYSQRRFNINGRICLETMIPFGFLLVLAILYVNPFILNVKYILNDKIINIFISIYFIIFIADLILSFNIVNNFRKTSYDASKDSTKEINKLVKELFSKGYLKRRLVNAFPKLNVIIKEK